MKPLIGISPTPNESTYNHGHVRRYALANTYSAAVIAAGGIPVILPAHPELVDDVLDALDGIIFSGGGDIDPRRLGEEKHPEAGSFDDERDEFELGAIPKVVERDIPMLGICRGIQTINVALGGSIYQDVPDQIPGSIQHRQQKDGKNRDDRSHDVTINDGDNPLRRIHDLSTMTVNSFHHQSVKEVAPGMEAIASAADGVIEATWHPGMTFGLAVQWHPEMLAAEYPDQAAIFRAFVDAAAQKKAERHTDAVTV